LLLPIYNDWECAVRLLEQIDALLAQEPGQFQVLLLDDCSIHPMPPALLQARFQHLRRVETLRLRRNLGNQRAIAIGLSYIHAQRPCDAVLIMDGDGEDKPEDAIRLARRFRETGGQRVIFAERVRRSENRTFRVCYQAFRFMHRVLTGIEVKFGNFSIVPYQHLASLVVVSETWNHYAASILKARLPFESIPTERGKRFAGESTQNFIALIVHGLAAISVFSETVGVRLILAIVATAGLAGALLFVVVGIKLFSTLAIPGWATNAAGFLLVILLQILTVAVGLTLTVLFSRNSLSFLPVRDYPHFVGLIQTIYDAGN